MPQTFKNEEKAFRKIESNISIKCINRRSKKSYLWRSHKCCFYGLDVRRKMEGDFGQSGLALLAGTNISFKSIKEISLISYLIYSLLLICNHVVTNRKVLDIPPMLVNLDYVFLFFPSRLQLGWCFSIFLRATGPCFPHKFQGGPCA